MKDTQDNQDANWACCFTAAVHVFCVSFMSWVSFLSFPEKVPAMTQGFIPPHGGYQKLLSYQKAEIIFDATVHFCSHFIDRRSRTHDQMVQAARSGKQNIVEGSMASATSKETEIKLTNVARASLEELLTDYRDFLRTRGLTEWSEEHPYAKRLRALCRLPNATYATFRKGIEHPNPAICANVIIGLIRVTSYLLGRQLESLEQSFLKKGGLRERMTRARLDERKKPRS
jgi:four helix bundle suffix protein